MTSKFHAKLAFRIYSFLWMTLVLLFVSLIWRGLVALLAFNEEQHALGHYVDIGSYIALITHHLLTNWTSETFTFIGQIIGLACLFHIGPPLEKVTIKEDVTDQGSVSGAAEYLQKSP